jgi:hypothetical protein
MINGINLNDFGGGNQLTFQPTIGTIEEFKVENSTFRAEYGFKSGAIVNMATRSGTNEWHGEVYDYLRHRGTHRVRAGCEKLREPCGYPDGGVSPQPVRRRRRRTDPER